ncbi:MAG: bifunctional riboflavin kinase/FAD synthetase [Filimonas sp.]|nr:bifunctional riboflavin kinase/FAD synthetase [Filimonas sp.]
MLVHRDIAHLPVFKNAVITIGTFDGVHTGHQQILAQLKEEARAIDGETVIITFHPHPRLVVSHGANAVQLLTTLEEKIALLEAAGIDHLVVTPFNEAFAEQSAEAYVHDFLVAKFHPHTVIIGYDHKFGKNRQGDYHLLEQKGAELGFAVKEIPGHVLNEAAISSTRIREALLQNDIETANKCLGHTYFFDGLIVEGNKLGRTIGYPTANLQMAEGKLIPGNGVYAVEAILTDEPGIRLKGMMNIGVRPTVDGTKRTVEVNIFDFDRDIYGKTLRVFIKKYLRGEQKFSGLDGLKAQLAEDKKNAAENLKM